MTVRTKLLSGDRASTASPSLIAMLLGCCALGTVGHVYAFDPGDDVVGTLGAGPLTDGVLYLHRTTGGRINVCPCTPTWSACPSVVHVGSGPAVTAALSDNATGCYDDHSILATVTVAGANGVGQMSIAYDGVTVSETIVIPNDVAPSLLGTVDLTGITLSTLNSTTLVFTAPAAFTVTFTTPTSVEDIAAQINAAAVGGTKANRAEIVQSSTGTKKLRLYTTTLGSGVTLTIDDATSTGEAILGFSSGAANLTVAGTAAAAVLPYTNIKLSFAIGTYKKGDTYALACTGPRASIAALAAGAAAARDDHANNPFGFMLPVQPSDTATNCAGLQATLSGLTATWLADTVAPINVMSVVGSPFHTASATLATNDANIVTADTALIAAFAAASANLDSVAVDDVYLPGAANLRIGRFRRTAALAWAAKRGAAAKIAQDVADGTVPEASLKSPDGVTRARDDARATTKLGTGSGPGFSALKATSAGLGSPKFAPGATRAGPTSRLRYAGVVAIGLEIARLAFGVVESWEGQTIPTDPLTGKIQDGEKSNREDAIRAALKPTLKPDNGVQNVSSFSVAIDNSGKFIDTGNVPVKISFVPLGEIESVDVTISAVGVVTIT